MQKNLIDEVFPETLKVLSELIKFQTVSGTSNIDLINYCEISVALSVFSHDRSISDLPK